MRAARFFWLTTSVIALSLLAWQLAEKGLGSHDLGTIAFWIVLLAAVDLLPVSLGLESQITMGFPIRFAIAILFRDNPGLAMLIGGLAAFDIREVRGEIELIRTIFNRLQSALSVATAAFICAAFLNPFNPIVVALAAMAQVATNLGLVSISVTLHQHAPYRRVLSVLVPKPRAGFALSYIVLTALGAVTAVVANEIGNWAVAAVLIPLLFARLSILGARRQQELSEKVRKQQEDLLHATEKVFQEREAERHRIAEDIHDASLQLLTAASYSFRNASRAIEEGQYPEARAAVETAGRALDDGIDQLRDSLVDLRRSSMAEGGLMETMNKYADELSTLWGTTITLEGEITKEPPTPVALAAFQIFQEALTNALKHANSQEVSVRVENQDGLVHIVVEDNGEGFDTTTEAGPEHVGMDLMKERAARVGGRIELQSIPGEGTRIEAILPGGVAVNQ
ncbi:MAG: ATP-binding protein [Actinomycetota bacterium]